MEHLIKVLNRVLMEEEARGIIQRIKNLYDQIDKHDMLNEQWVLRFCDKLNELSIKY